MRFASSLACLLTEGFALLIGRGRRREGVFAKSCLCYQPTDTPASRRRHPGFTLTEVLVAISVIAILVVLTVAGYSGALSAAHRSGCASNLRSIGVAIFNYSADPANAGRLPPSVSDRYVTWDRTLVEGGYLGNAEVFKCPADRALRDDSLAGEPAIPRSYAINSNMFTDGSSAAWYPPGNPSRAANGRLSRATRPHSAIILAWDRAPETNWYGRFASLAFSSLAANVDPNASHDRGANYLFADGHVEFLDYQDLGQGDFTREYFYARP